MAQTIHLASGAARWTARIDGDRITLDDTRALTVRDEGDGRFRIETPDGATMAVAAISEQAVWVGVDGYVLEFRIEHSSQPPASAARDRDALTAPMPATVVRIQAHPGDRVQAGDTLVVLEAMKMELPIRAPRAARVVAVHCREGEMVQPGKTVVELDDR